MNDNKINIGVVGAGHLGSYHIEKYIKIKNVNFIGFYDSDQNRSKTISNKYKVESFHGVEKLLELCDAISIVTPTSTHYEVAKLALKFGCHVFIEKPITDSLNKANTLIDLASQKNLFIQVGHIERFNPAFLAVNIKDIKPLYLDSRRFSPFPNRGTDVDVILDLMIHDIDIILHIVQSKVKSIDSSGIKVLSNFYDFVTTRIQFENNCVAHISANRCAKHQVRKLNVYEENVHTSIDFLNTTVEKLIITENKRENESFELFGNHENKSILYKNDIIKKHDALNMELNQFIMSIKNIQKPEVDGLAATKALKLAIDIQKSLKN